MFIGLTLGTASYCTMNCDGLFSFITWVRYGSHLRIRYGSGLIVFLLICLVLWYVTYTLIVTSYYAYV